jgi:DNA-binding IclR family transcriptional regulator
VERAADVLLLFARSDAPQLGVTEIAKALGLSKTSVHRILSSLRNKGIVELDPTLRKYALGPVITNLGFTYLNELDVRKVAAPELTNLSRATQETATLSVRTRHGRAYVDQVTPDREVLMSVQIGISYPLHAGASSKALLAFLPDDEIERYLEEPLDRLTARTVTDAGKLRQELTEIRARGWAQSLGERQPGAGSVAAPILDYRSYALAVVSVCGPVDRLASEASMCAKQLVAATTRISARMGRPGAVNEEVAAR